MSNHGGRHGPLALIGKMRLPAERPLRRLAAGQFGSQLADWLTAAALVGWIYERTSSTAQVALLLLVRIAPPVLGGGLAARLVDRVPKGRLLVRLELARGAVFASAAAGVAAGARPLVFAAVFVAAALGTMSATSVSALVPALVEDERLPAANAFVGTVAQVAAAGGLFGAGALLGLVGAPAALACAAAAAVGAAASYRALRPLDAARPPVARASRRLRTLAVRYALVTAIGAFMLATLATMLASATLPRFLGGELGLGESGYAFGIGAVAVGVGFGQALAGRRPRFVSGPAGIALPLFATAALFVALSRAPSAGVALAVLACVGVSDGVSEIAFQTTVQREAGPELVGLAFGVGAALIKLSGIGALALAPLVNAVAAPRFAILVGAVPLCLGGFAALAGRPLARALAPEPAL